MTVYLNTTMLFKHIPSTHPPPLSQMHLCLNKNKSIRENIHSSQQQAYNFTSSTHLSDSPSLSPWQNRWRKHVSFPSTCWLQGSDLGLLAWQSGTKERKHINSVYSDMALMKSLVFLLSLVTADQCRLLWYVQSFLWI